MNRCSGVESCVGVGPVSTGLSSENKCLFLLIFVLNHLHASTGKPETVTDRHSTDLHY